MSTHQKRIRPCPISGSQLKNSKKSKVKNYHNLTIAILFIHLENKNRRNNNANMKMMNKIKIYEINLTKLTRYGQKRHSTITTIRVQVI